MLTLILENNISCTNMPLIYLRCYPVNHSQPLSLTQTCIRVYLSYSAGSTNPNPSHPYDNPISMWFQMHTISYLVGQILQYTFDPDANPFEFSSSTRHFRIEPNGILYSCYVIYICYVPSYTTLHV